MLKLRRPSRGPQPAEPMTGAYQRHLDRVAAGHVLRNAGVEHPTTEQREQVAQTSRGDEPHRAHVASASVTAGKADQSWAPPSLHDALAVADRYARGGAIAPGLPASPFEGQVATMNRTLRAPSFRAVAPHVLSMPRSIRPKFALGGSTAMPEHVLAALDYVARGRPHFDDGGDAGDGSDHSGAAGGDDGSGSGSGSDDSGSGSTQDGYGGGQSMYGGYDSSSSSSSSPASSGSGGIGSDAAASSSSAPSSTSGAGGDVGSAGPASAPVASASAPAAASPSVGVMSGAALAGPSATSGPVGSIPGSVGAPAAGGFSAPAGTMAGGFGSFGATPAATSNPGGLTAATPNASMTSGLTAGQSTAVSAGEDGTAGGFTAASPAGALAGVTPGGLAPSVSPTSLSGYGSFADASPAAAAVVNGPSVTDPFSNFDSVGVATGLPNFGPASPAIAPTSLSSLDSWSGASPAVAAALDVAARAPDGLGTVGQPGYGLSSDHLAGFDNFGPGADTAPTSSMLGESGFTGRDYASDPVTAAAQGNLDAPVGGSDLGFASGPSTMSPTSATSAAAADAQQGLYGDAPSTTTGGWTTLADGSAVGADGSYYGPASDLAPISDYTASTPTPAAPAAAAASAPPGTDPSTVDGVPALTVHGWGALDPSISGTPSLMASGVPGTPDLSGYTSRMQAFEDPAGDPTAVSPTGAYGLSQFTQGTWNGLRNNYPGLGLPSTPQQATQAQYSTATDALTNENVSALAGAGIEPTYGAAYLAHNVGISAAISALSSPDGTPIGQAGIPASSMTVNQPVFNGVQTVGDLKAKLDSIMGPGTIGADTSFNGYNPAGMPFSTNVTADAINSLPNGVPMHGLQSMEGAINNVGGLSLPAFGRINALTSTADAAPSSPALTGGAAQIDSGAASGADSMAGLGTPSPAVTTTTMQPSPYSATPSEANTLAGPPGSADDGSAPATPSSMGFAATPANALALHAFGLENPADPTDPANTAYNVLAKPSDTPISSVVSPAAMANAQAQVPGLFNGVQTVGDLRANLATIAATAGPQVAVTTTQPGAPAAAAAPDAAIAGIRAAQPTYADPAAAQTPAEIATNALAGVSPAAPAAPASTPDAPAAPAPAKSLSVPSAVTNTAAGVALGALGPVGMGIAGANAVSGLLGGPTLGSLVNNALSHAGQPTSVTGSGVGGSNSDTSNEDLSAYGYVIPSAGASSDDTSSSSAAPTTPFTTAQAAYDAAMAGMHQNTSHDWGWLDRIVRPQGAPQVAMGAPYDPMRDPQVRRALGLP